ncbi:MAG TPA: acyltransferase [Bacteroidota bacterium]|nr:acyltransferase [Bacteroidota bacterium]
MDKQLKRIHFLDVMRGFAVVVMVMGHSIDAVLSRELRATDWFRVYDTFRGFTAPMFLFVSGFAYAVATLKRWDDFRTFSAPLLKRLRRIGLLFLIGYALHFPYFSFGRIVHEAKADQLAQMFQADILHCVAASLLILHVLILLTPSRRVFARILTAIAGGVVLVSPIVWNIDFAPIVSPVLSPYFNQSQLSIFPLFPFAAFLFTGVVVGLLFLEARERKAESRFVTRLSWTALAAIVIGITFDLVPVQVYPPHDFWKSSPSWFAIRVGIVALVSMGFYKLRSLPDSAVRLLTMLGQASLLVYAVHLMIAYGSPINHGLMQEVGQTLAAHLAFAVGLTVLACMIVLTYLWHYIRTEHRLPARVVQFGLASTVLYSFFLTP